MRTLAWLVAAVACLLSLDVAAQNDIQLVISAAETVAAGQSHTTALRCPTGYYPIGLSVNPAVKGRVSYFAHYVIDNKGHRVDPAALPDGSSMSGGGFEIQALNEGVGHAENYAVVLFCQKLVGTVTYIKQSVSVAPGAMGNLTGFCSAGSATGAISNVGQNGLQDSGGAPVGGTPAAPQYLGNFTGSMMPPVAGWETSAVNTSTTAQTLSHLIVCQTLPPMTNWYVYSKQLPADSQFDFIVSPPAGTRPIALGFDGFPNARPLRDIKTWHAEGSVPIEAYVAGLLPPAGVYLPDQDLWSAVIRIQRNFIPQAKAGNTVVGAVLATTVATPPPPTVATVVEFYNAALDHYFITAAPPEIADLDNGVHKGWARTGQSFHTYAAQSSGPTTRQPVCRAYGNPAAGLDSHFYSASIPECYDTLGKFAGAWLLEASEVFQVDLPDTTTGACPAGDIPVYRLFNNRADANHRYTTSTAIRDQMVARGYVAEGYGPNSVTLCALP